MDNHVKPTFVPQSDQSSPDGDSAVRSKTPTFHVQSGIRAGGFYDWWRGVAEGFNMFDRATGAG